MKGKEGIKRAWKSDRDGGRDKESGESQNRPKFKARHIGRVCINEAILLLYSLCLLTLLISCLDLLSNWYVFFILYDLCFS